MHIVTIKAPDKNHRFMEDKQYFFSIGLKTLAEKKSFTETIHKHIPSGETYFILVKIRYGNDRYGNDRYIMLSKQSIFKFEYPYTESIEDFRMEIINQLSNRLEQYNVDIEDILYINIIVSKINRKFITDLEVDTTNLNAKEQSLIMKIVKYFPLENDPLIIKGEITDITYDSEGYVEKINIPAYPNIDFISRLNENVSYLKIKKVGGDNIMFDKTYRFFLRDVYKQPYLLVINYITENRVNKNAYTLNGNFIGNVVDINHGNRTYRQQGNVNYKIDNNVIIEKSIYKQLPVIKRADFIPKNFGDNHASMISDPRIAVIDLETYKDMKNQQSKVYAAGLKRNGHSAILFYIDRETLNSNAVIYRLLDELFKPKYNDITIYCHNLGNFDSLYIIKALLDYNNTYKDHYKIETFLRESSILKIKITIVDEDGKKRSVTIKDSYPILTYSLAYLCRVF